MNLHLGGASFPRLVPVLHWLFVAHLRSAAALVALTELHAAHQAHERALSAARPALATTDWATLDAGPVFAEAAALVHTCTRRMRVPSLLEDEDDEDDDTVELTNAPASFGTWPRLAAVAAELGVAAAELRAWLLCTMPLRCDSDSAHVHTVCDAADAQCAHLYAELALAGVQEAPVEADEWRALARLGEWRVARLRCASVNEKMSSH